MPSSVIDHFEYDSATSVLSVCFVTGRCYRYFAVPAWEALALKAAGSKGRYFNAHIRDRYPYEEVLDRRLSA